MTQYLKEVLFLISVDKFEIPKILGLFLVSSALDIIGLGVLGPYIAMLDDSSAAEVVVNKVIGGAVDLSKQNLIFIFGMLLIAIFFTKSVATILINQVILRFSLGQQTKLRASLMRSFQSMPYSVYLRRSSAEYLHSIERLTTIFSMSVLMPGLRLISDSLITVFIVIFLVIKNPVMLLSLAGLLFILIFLYDRFFKHKLKIYGVNTNDAVIKTTKSIQEGLEGLKEIRILAKEEYFFNKLYRSSTAYENFYVRAQLILLTPRILIEFLMVLFLVLYIFVSLLLNPSNSSLFPVLSVFAVAALRLVPATNNISNSIALLRFNRNSISVLYNDMRAAKKSHLIVPEQSRWSGEERGGGFRSLELKNIYFKYETATSFALKGVSLSFVFGECIGFVGKSGSGKSTLLDVLLGLLLPNSGNIIYNGRALTENNLRCWQDRVAYLPQNIFLIDDTLRRNIALGVEDHLIDEARVMTALRQAQLFGMSQRLPNGLDTIIGERGVRLSGGQRQRIAIARAFYHQRDVLILDEATSSLDNETEFEIVNEILRLKRRMTLIIIAHRLATVQHCDRIYRVEDGEVVASYAPSEL